MEVTFSSSQNIGVKETFKDLPLKIFKDLVLRQDRRKSDSAVLYLVYSFFVAKLHLVMQYSNCMTFI